MDTTRAFQMPRKYHLLIIIFGLLLVFLITLAFVSVPVTNILIHLSLPLKKEGFSSTLANWLRIPFPIITSFYLFNVTNVPQVLSGSAKPILQEIGPFVYEEHREKINVVWSDDWSTASYNQTRTHYFRADLSTPHVALNDKINHLNVLVASAVEFARRADDPFIYNAIDEMIRETNSTIFTSHTIDELLFAGYNDPLIDETKGLSDFPYDKFGWMYARNATSTDGRYTVATGVSSLRDIGRVVSWNNHETLDLFSGDCSHFGAANAGDLFAPDSGADEIRLFVGDTCRPISLNLDADHSRYPYMTFTGDESTYATNGTCYCTETPCPPNGIANISACVSGSPVYISFPHFLHGHPSLLQQFDGLQPNQSRHSFFFQVDEKLGIPSQVNVAMQLNVALTVNDAFKFTKFQAQPTVYYPCVYFTSSAGLSRAMKMSLDFLHFGLPVILITVPALLALFCLMAIALLARKIYRLSYSDGLNERLISTDP